MSRRRKKIDTIHIDIMEILRLERQIRREEDVEAGVYNQRRRHIHTDKKKEKNRRKCREKVNYE